VKTLRGHRDDLLQSLAAVFESINVGSPLMRCFSVMVSR